MKFREIIVRSIDEPNGEYIDSNGATQQIAPLEIYLVPKSNGEHDRYVFDQNSVSSIQSGHNAIPLTGTEANKPVTGDIVSTKDIVFNITSDRPARLKHYPNPRYSVSFGDMNPTTTGTQNNGFGIGALRSVTSGSWNNAFGCSSLVALTTGNYNSAFGDFSLSKIVNSNNNTAYGAYAGSELTTGNDNTSIGLASGSAATTGNYNTFLGASSGYDITDGFKNVMIGFGTSINKNTNLNTVIGYKAGYFDTPTSGHDRNILIGAQAGSNMIGQNSIMIGNGAGHNGDNSNKLIIHNSRLTGYTNTSEGNYNDFNEGTYDYGLITGDFFARLLTFNANNIAFRQAGNSTTAITITPNAGAGITSAIQYNPTDSKDFIQKKYADDLLIRQEFEILSPTNNFAPTSKVVHIFGQAGSDTTVNITSAIQATQEFVVINMSPSNSTITFQINGVTKGSAILAGFKRIYTVTANGSKLISVDQSMTEYTL